MLNKGLRIIGGKYRGRKIKQPSSCLARPTKDRIREAVFNMIASKIPGTVSLDLFSGSGAFGLEAISRGSERCVFSENNEECISIIKNNITSLGVESKVEIMEQDSFRSVELLAEEKRKFDLVFSDPPYNRGMARKTLNIIYHYDILNVSGLLIIEHHCLEELSREEFGANLYKQKTYGDISISIFQKND